MSYENEGRKTEMEIGIPFSNVVGNEKWKQKFDSVFQYRRKTEKKVLIPFSEDLENGKQKLKFEFLFVMP